MYNYLSSNSNLSYPLQCDEYVMKMFTEIILYNRKNTAVFFKNEIRVYVVLRGSTFIDNIDVLLKAPLPLNLKKKNDFGINIFTMAVCFYKL